MISAKPYKSLTNTGRPRILLRKRLARGDRKGRGGWEKTTLDS